MAEEGTKPLRKQPHNNNLDRIYTKDLSPSRL